MLAPRGGWAPFPCALRQHDAVIELADASVLVLHKGRLPAIPKARLAEVVADWGCVYANEVFVVFARGRRSGSGLDAARAWLHLRSVHAHLKSRELKRREATVWHVHLPKTGGTSLWSSLSRTFRSSVYYGDVCAFLANPPAPGEYDLVGGHIAPSLLDGLVRPGDLVTGLVREPTARLLSSVVHSRRAGEDKATFTPSQQAMREMRLREFVATDHGRHEAHVQLFGLGWRPDAEGGGEGGCDAAALLDRALDFVGRDETLAAPSEASEALLRRLEQHLGFRLRRSRALNANPPADYARYAEEFAEARPAIEALNADERRLYAEVQAQFARG